MDITPGEDENGKHRKYQPENMPKYKKIWNKVFELAERYGIKAFTGWGISDALSWHRNIGCTMVEKDGTVKEWAKYFFTRRKQKENHSILEGAVQATEEQTRIGDINEQSKKIKTTQLEKTQEFDQERNQE